MSPIHTICEVAQRIRRSVPELLRRGCRQRDDDSETEPSRPKVSRTRSSLRRQSYAQNVENNVDCLQPREDPCAEAADHSVRQDHCAVHTTMIAVSVGGESTSKVLTMCERSLRYTSVPIRYSLQR